MIRCRGQGTAYWTLSWSQPGTCAPSRDTRMLALVMMASVSVSECWRMALCQARLVSCCVAGPGGPLSLLSASWMKAWKISPLDNARSELMLTNQRPVFRSRDPY